jgi:hypothetical protein
MYNVLIFFKSIKFGYSFLLHGISQMISKGSTKLFFKNHFLLNKGFQDLIKRLTISRKISDMSRVMIHQTTP